MSEYTEVEQQFLQQLASLGWTVIAIADSVVTRQNQGETVGRHS